MEQALMLFIQQSYHLQSTGSQIFLLDVFEKKKNEPTMIDITQKVKFIWGKAFDITAINLYKKDLSHIPTIIREVFRDERSLDFYKFLINEREVINIPLRDVKDEFPGLYGNRLQEIISKNTTKDNL